MPQPQRLPEGRVLPRGPKTAEQILDGAGLPPRKNPKRLVAGRRPATARRHRRDEDRRPADRLPLAHRRGAGHGRASKSGVEAEFYTSVTRPAAVYRGNPFQIEVGLAYGGKLPGDELAKVMRFANRVPLLYQASACADPQGGADQQLAQLRPAAEPGALPTGPLVDPDPHGLGVGAVHLREQGGGGPLPRDHQGDASWPCRRPAGSSGATSAAARENATPLKKQSYIQKYIPHIGDALQEILGISDGEKEEIIATLTDTLERSRKL